MTHRRTKEERRTSVNFPRLISFNFRSTLTDKRKYSGKLDVKTVDNPFCYQIIFVSDDNAARATISQGIFADVLLMVSCDFNDVVMGCDRKWSNTSKLEEYFGKPC